jgi:hypothetical protein
MTIQILTKPKIVVKNGQPTEVILKWKDFQELLEKIEDTYDLSEIKKIKKRPKLREFGSFLKEYAL